MIFIDEGRKLDIGLDPERLWDLKQISRTIIPLPGQHQLVWDPPRRLQSCVDPNEPGEILARYEVPDVQNVWTTDLISAFDAIDHRRVYDGAKLAFVNTKQDRPHPVGGQAEKLKDVFAGVS